MSDIIKAMTMRNLPTKTLTDIFTELPVEVPDEAKNIRFIEKDNDFWLPGEEIGRFLGYSFPREAINQIFRRHEDELRDYSVEIKLISADGKKYTQRIYNEEGCYLISFFAKTPKSKLFRRVVARILKELNRKKACLIRMEACSALLALQERLKRKKKDDTFLRRLIRYRQMGLSQWEVGLLLKCSRTTVRTYEKLLKESGLWEVLPCKG